MVRKKLRDLANLRGEICYDSVPVSFCQQKEGYQQLPRGIGD
jgi:hypothetical protein